jgi:hypothetical protein
MTRSSPRRLWVPAVAGIGGSAISLAVGIGQHTWAATVIGETVTAIAVVFIYLTAKRDSDLGALLGLRADERQELIRLKASRVSAVVAVAGSVVACVIAAAINAAYWPFEALYITSGAAYLVSIRVYGAREEVEKGDSAEDDSGTEL